MGEEGAYTLYRKYSKDDSNGEKSVRRCLPYAISTPSTDPYILGSCLTHVLMSDT